MNDETINTKIGKIQVKTFPDKPGKKYVSLEDAEKMNAAGIEIAHDVKSEKSNTKA